MHRWTAVPLVALIALAAVPASRSQDRIREEASIPYVDAAAPKQHLDLYLPDAKGFPVALFVHGGSLQSGDRTEEPYPEICRNFDRAGIGCAATSYRLFPDVKWPAPVEDVAAATAWLAHNIEKRGGDPEHLVLIGHSSGCQLVTLVGSDTSRLAPYDMAPRDLFGVIALGCRVNQRQPDPTGRTPEEIERFFTEHTWGRNFTDVETMLSFHPMNFVGSHMPPYRAWIAEEERFKPPILADAAVYVGAVRDAGVDADIRIFPGMTHDTSMRSLADPQGPVFRAALSFIRRPDAAAREGGD